MSIDAAETIAALTALGARARDGMRDTVNAVLADLQDKAQGFAPIGTEGNATDPPGTLRDSIVPTPAVGSGGIYTGDVGPTTIYGRQRELGGPIDPKRVGGWMIFEIFGERVRTDHVYQHPEPYMKPARDLEDAPAIRITLEKMTAVIAGS